MGPCPPGTVTPQERRLAVIWGTSLVEPHPSVSQCAAGGSVLAHVGHETPTHGALPLSDPTSRPQSQFPHLWKGRILKVFQPEAGGDSPCPPHPRGPAGAGRLLQSAGNCILLGYLQHHAACCLLQPNTQVTSGLHSLHSLWGPGHPAHSKHPVKTQDCGTPCRAPKLGSPPTPPGLLPRELTGSCQGEGPDASVPLPSSLPALVVATA